MARDPAYDRLVAELAALGRTVPVPTPTPTPGLAVAVMSRLASAPTPVRAALPTRLLDQLIHAVSRWRRRVVAVVAAVLVATLVAPPVRATVTEWFSFAGVIVRQDDTPPSTTARPPTVAAATTLEEARELVDFDPLVPAELGPPTGVQVSADGRVLSMGWTDEDDGVLRLDQFDGRLDYVFAKTTPGVEFTAVAGAFALWFDEPHEVVVIQPDGTRRAESARLAGRTLIWESGGTTLRLEGDLALARAVEVAESVAVSD